MIKVLFEAPVLTQSGYGEHARLTFRALETVEGMEIYTNPLNWGATSWSKSFSPDLSSRIDASINRFVQDQEIHKRRKEKPRYDVQVHVGILNEFEKKAEYSVCVTAGIETDRVSLRWIEKTWSGLDRLVVPSEHSKKGFVQSQYEVKHQNYDRPVTVFKNPETAVNVVPYPFKDVGVSHIDLDISTKFNFLSVALMGPRKNIENMVKWFIEEFHDEDVGLILKTCMAKSSTADKHNTVQHLKSITDKYSDRKCKVYLVHGDLTEEEIHSLYVREDIHAYINLAHGEGFGLPIFEAAYSGMPIIATDWSGHLDFLSASYKEGNKTKNKKLFAKVDYDLQTVPKNVLWKDIIVEGSHWANPKKSSYKKQIRKVFQDYGMYKKWASVLKNNIVENYTEEVILKKMREAMFGEGFSNKVVSIEDKNWQEENKKITRVV